MVKPIKKYFVCANSCNGFVNYFPSNLDENTIRKNLKNAILAELKKINAKISSFKLKVKF